MYFPAKEGMARLFELSTHLREADPVERKDRGAEPHITVILLVMVAIVLTIGKHLILLRGKIQKGGSTAQE